MTNNNKIINNTNVDMTNIIFKMDIIRFSKRTLQADEPKHESNALFHVKYFPPIENSYKIINIA